LLLAAAIALVLALTGALTPAVSAAGAGVSVPWVALR
jgi:hypothetical protein